MKLRIKNLFIPLLVVLFMTTLVNSTNAQIGKLGKKLKVPSKTTIKKSNSSESSSSESSSSKSSANTSSDGEYSGKAKFDYGSVVKYQKEAEECSGDDRLTKCSLGDRRSSLVNMKRYMDKLHVKDPDYDMSTFEASYKKHEDLYQADKSTASADAVPFEMKEYNTSSLSYPSIKFSGFDMGDNKLVFYVTITTKDGKEWKKKVKHSNSDKNPEYFRARTETHAVVDGSMVFKDKEDELAFLIISPGKEQTYGMCYIGHYTLSLDREKSPILLFGGQSSESLRAEVKKIKFTSGNEEAERTALEKNNVGKIIFSNEDISKTLPQTSLSNRFTVGDEIYSRTVFNEPSASIGSLFLRDAIPATIYNSFLRIKFYKNGKLITTYNDESFAATDSRDMFDKWRSYREPIYTKGEWLRNTNNFWQAFATSDVSNGESDIKIECYVVYNKHAERTKHKEDDIEIKLAEGTFKLTINDTGMNNFCANSDFGLPKAKNNDATTKRKLLTAIQEKGENSKWKEKFTDVIILSDWVTANNQLTGVGMFYTIDAAAVAVHPDGVTRVQEFSFKKDKNTGVISHYGTGGSQTPVCIRCSK